jgi:hypothetical protein
MNFLNTLKAIVESASPPFDTKGPDVIEHRGRFYVNMGRPGFNTRANNSNGYATREGALGVMQRFGGKQ